MSELCMNEYNKNSLPMYIRDVNLTLPKFKQHLKLYLFCVAYDITIN